MRPVSRSLPQKGKSTRSHAAYKAPLTTSDSTPSPPPTPPTGRPADRFYIAIVNPVVVISVVGGSTTARGPNRGVDASGVPVQQICDFGSRHERFDVRYRQIPVSNRCDEVQLLIMGPHHGVP